MNAKELKKHLKSGVTEFAVYPQRQPGGYVPAKLDQSDYGLLKRAVVLEDGVEWERTIWSTWGAIVGVETLRSGVRVRLVDTGAERVVERRAIISTWEEHGARVEAQRRIDAVRARDRRRALEAAVALGGVAVGQEVRLDVGQAEALVRRLEGS